ELFLVSLPLIISAGSNSLMSVADRVMLAGYAPSDAAATTLDLLAAVTPASMLHWTVVCIPLGTILYANTFISQYDGAGKPREMIASLWQAVWLAVLTGLLLAPAAPLSPAVFSFAGHEPAVIAQESAYFGTLCYGSPLLLLSTALSCFFSGRRRTAVVMWVNLIGLVINVALDYVLIFGRFGLPELGITGAALATLGARVGDIAIYAFLIRRENRRHQLPLTETLKPDVELLKKYLRFGVPSGMHYFVDNSAFLVFLFIVGSLSRNDMAATNLAFSINSLIFIPLLGFGTAVQTLVGHHIGAGLVPAAVRTTWNAVRMSLVWTGTASVLLILFPGSCLMLFRTLAESSPDQVRSIETVLPLAATLLRFVAVYSVFDAMAVVFASALRGAGDTVFPMLLTMVSGWLIMTLPAWWLARSADTSVTSLWLTCTAHIIVMGTAMTLRFLSGRWKQIHLT
ncbi:MAG: MATE family efflux transporter, partial [Planctomycetaceae bacterium]|nr:MATE family efflux transporter [Planctomycetaceae bacterium]